MLDLSDPRIHSPVMRILTLCLLVLLIVACGGNDTKGPELRNDPALLGPEQTVPALGIAIRAPLPFQPAPPGYLERSQQEIANSAQKAEPWFIMPQLIFGIPNANGRCFVSGFPNQDGVKFDEAWRARYHDAASKMTAPVPVEPRVYGAGKNAVHSYIIQNAGLVNQRFLVTGSAGKVVQVDFLMPALEWEALSPAIESAIASIRPL